MNRLYLHIGMPKTGSSAIQALLTLNNQILAKNGVAFPNPPEFSQPYQTSAGNANFLSTLFLNNEMENIEEYLDSFDGEDVVILSSESLFHILIPYSQRFFQVLENYDYKIICYVRRQDSLLSSSYNQTIKNHDETSPRITDKIASLCDFSLALSESLKYCKANRFMIRPYEKQQFYGGNIYTDFLHCIGLELTEEYVFPEDIVNPSLSWEALEFRRILNILGIDRNDYEKKNYLNGLLGKYTVEHNQGRPFQDDTNIFTTEERIQIIKDYEERNAQIARIFLNREDGKMFLDPLPEPNEGDVRKQAHLTVDKTLDICQFLLKSKVKENLEEEMIKSIAKGTIERLFSNETINEIEEMPVIYRLEDDPLDCSRDIVKFERKFGFWLIESSGIDPYFTIPHFEEIKNEGKLYVEIKITASSDTLLQLLFSSDTPEFDPDHCFSRKIKKGYNEIIIKIEETVPIKSLRVDPGINEGIYLLHDLIVRKPMKTVISDNPAMIYRLEKNTMHHSCDIKAIERKNNYWYIESTGIDPFFIIPDFDSFKNEGEIWAEINITAPCDTIIQMFCLSDNQEFDEYHSKSRLIKKGYNVITIYFNESKAIKALRLDPGNSEGIYLLHCFTVRRV